ncbi:ABC transporter substrate-binding protein [Limnochorda pilosa]|uniref:ABC transmembrane type-1 domain-containing protein n=1 Tax=Limnochorda pilosa TaxID=1555112 RepID=A0A0K2SKZ1_LIMPI|nr:ABC transporter substrate-binding protein [Limnochorda pilosa]BAS27786.1 hypothetical protein LIP_1945 [Limnochorda pilosa]
MIRWRIHASRWAAPGLGLAAGLLAWEGGVRLWQVPPWLLPTPSEIGRELAASAALMLPHLQVTLVEALLGLVLAVVVGLTLAIGIHVSPLLARVLEPWLVASQTVPVVALAPVLTVWFGYTLLPKVLVVAILCFFPVVVNTVDGLRGTDPDYLRLMRTLRLGHWVTFREVELPNALPYFFSGLRLAAAWSVVGAIFGEWVGTDEGMGYLMIRAISQFQTSRLFGAIALLSAAGFALFALTRLVEYLSLPWLRSHEEASRHGSRPSGRHALLAVGVAGLLTVGFPGPLDLPHAEAASPSGAPEKVDVILDWQPNADHVGIYAARAMGAFEDEGLQVALRVPADPSAALTQVAAGRSDLAITYAPELLQARSQGIPVVSVMELVQRPLNSVISLVEAGIRRPADLAGRTVGVPGTVDTDAILRSILVHDGVDPGQVRAINVGYDLIPALLSRRVDAIVGGFWNVEGVEVELLGFDPRVIHVEEWGVPNNPALILATSEQTLARRGDVLRRFLRALSRGYETVVADPAQGARHLLDQNPDLDRELARRGIELLAPVLLDPATGRPGLHDLEEWRAFAAWMVEMGLLPGLVNVDEAVTNRLLDPEG